MTMKELLESDDDLDRLEGWLRRVLEVVDAGEDFADESRYGREHAAIRGLLATLYEEKTS